MDSPHDYTSGDVPSDGCFLLWQFPSKFAVIHFILTFMCFGGHRDDSRWSRADYTWQEKASKQEMTQMVHTELGLEPILCLALGTCHNS
jgi:hypothetical protein